MIGQRLGPYEITAKLGEGGMGEVYRATDTKLDRQVAIKVLPAAFTADPERLARFEGEAQLLAQLQHPNIASIYGLEMSGGSRALVMELVNGPTLADQLQAGALPLEEELARSRKRSKRRVKGALGLLRQRNRLAHAWTAERQGMTATTRGELNEKPVESGRESVRDFSFNADSARIFRSAA